MMTKETIQERLRANFPHLAQEYGVERIGLFGSFASGTASDDSDVDVVVEFQQPLGFRFMDLVEELEQLLGRKVDVLTPEGVKSIRVEQVRRSIAESIVYV